MILHRISDFDGGVLLLGKFGHNGLFILEFPQVAT
jgi:hypothetical protein